MTWISDIREKQLRSELRELPELVATAATALPGEHLGGEGGPRVVPGSRPPLDMSAAALTGLKDLSADSVLNHPRRDGGLVWVDHRGRVRADDELPGSALSMLAAWVRLVEAEMLDAEARTAPPDDRPTVSGECAWLLRHIVWILEQQSVEELADDVRDLTRECRHVLRIRPTYRPHCQREGCGGQLVDEGSGLWRCDNCDHTAGDRGRLGLRATVARQDPMTVAELVRAYRLSVKTVESWVLRGKLEPVDSTSRPLRYHPIDALRLADDRGVEVGA